MFCNPSDLNNDESAASAKQFHSMKAWGEMLDPGSKSGVRPRLTSFYDLKY